MRRAMIVATCLVMALLITSCGDETETTSDTPFDPITYPVLFSSTEFTEASTCGGCHAEIYAAWQGSMHNNAMEDKLYQSLHALASKETNGAIDAFCTACHTPIGTMSGEVPPLQGEQVSDISRDGVQCDFCHTVTGSTGIGNAAYEFMPSNTKRGPFDDSVSPFHETAFSELHTKSEFCGMCHDVNHPINGTPLEATYTEWKNSDYAEAGVQCQDCHMTPGPSVTKPNPGQATADAPQRPHIWTHHFVGGNSSVLADEGHRKLAEDQLRAAASLSIDALAGATPGSDYSFEVDIANKGAGHYLPTGLTEVRQMWLEITITDANGKEIAHIGSVDASGDIDPDTVIYNTSFEDEEGNETHLPWEAVKIHYDNRVPPMGNLIEKYSTALPADAALPLTIKATLNYRIAPQSMVNDLMGDEAFEVPIVDMTTAEATVN